MNEIVSTKSFDYDKSILNLLDLFYKNGYVSVGYWKKDIYSNATLRYDHNGELYIYVQERFHTSEKEAKEMWEIDNDDVTYHHCYVVNEGSKPFLCHLAQLVYSTAVESDYAGMFSKFYSEERSIIEHDKNIAFNSLYHYIMSFLKLNKSRIRQLVTGGSPLEIFVNTAEFENFDKDEILPYDKMITDVQDSANAFVNAFYNAWDLFHKANNASNENEYSEYIDRYDEFLDSLDEVNIKNTDRSIDKLISVLSFLKIYYEILNDRSFAADPSIDCENEIEDLEVALLTPSKSAVLVGPPGVGKTAIVEGLAYRISKGDVPKALNSKLILKINAASLVSGCGLVGLLEEKLETVFNTIKKYPDIILFVDELHTLIGAGKGSAGGCDVANILKPYLDRGDIKMIGATTDEEYDKYVDNDRAFKRRFVPINVKEPNNETVFKILKGTIEKLVAITGINWKFSDKETDSLLNYIIDSSDGSNRLYLDYRYNPDLSIGILENAFAIARLRDYRSVTFKNVADAIKKCQLLYESSRTRISSEIIDKYYSPDYSSPVDSQPKIIDFVSYKKRNLVNQNGQGK